MKKKKKTNKSVTEPYAHRYVKISIFLGRREAPFLKL
jgi:hypothetical protein